MVDVVGQLCGTSHAYGRLYECRQDRCSHHRAEQFECKTLHTVSAAPQDGWLAFEQASSWRQHATINPTLNCRLQTLQVTVCQVAMTISWGVPALHHGTLKT